MQPQRHDEIPMPRHRAEYRSVVRQQRDEDEQLCPRPLLGHTRAAEHRGKRGADIQLLQDGRRENVFLEHGTRRRTGIPIRKKRQKPLADESQNGKHDRARRLEKYVL